ncbi:CDP-diacylglycerol--glycerol-3-phosphate 3-phosphatidyltransferase [Fretibacter rubidus]|uniref:CDP-diacylglycerol--glycerol-3-phosphate 3-phosphatidyltransferase n=1 Tax=Fretibacter rubidus TaxID=570162 RepID=UPI00352B2184
MTTEPTRHALYWVPNALTLGRIASIPVLIAGVLLMGEGSLSGFGKPLFVIGLFVLAMITDFLDGFLARRWGLVSDFGRMIDPIADKLLVAAVLIALCIVTEGTWVLMVPAMAIIGRDILVSGAREHAALSGRVMPPTKLAKYKTACEMLGLLVLLVWLSSRALLPVDSFIPALVEYSGIIGLTLIWIAAILSVYTGSLYLRAALAKVADS